MHVRSRPRSFLLAALAAAVIVLYAVGAGAQPTPDLCIMAPASGAPTIDGNVDGLESSSTPDGKWSGAATVTVQSDAGHTMTLQFMADTTALYIGGVVNNTPPVSSGFGNQFDTIVLGFAIPKVGTAATDTWRFIINPIQTSDTVLPYTKSLVLHGDPNYTTSTLFYSNDPGASGAWTTDVTSVGNPGAWLDPTNSHTNASLVNFGYGAQGSTVEFEIRVPVSATSAIGTGLALSTNLRMYVDFVAAYGVLGTTPGAIFEEYAWPQGSTIANSFSTSNSATVPIERKDAIPYVDKWATVLLGRTSCPPKYLVSYDYDNGTLPVDTNGDPGTAMQIPACSTATPPTQGPANSIMGTVHNQTTQSADVTAKFNWAAYGMVGGSWVNYSSTGSNPWTAVNGGVGVAFTQTLTINPNTAGTFGTTGSPAAAVAFTSADACQFHYGDTTGTVSDPHPCLQAVYTTTNPSVHFESDQGWFVSAIPAGSLPAGAASGITVQRNMVWSTASRLVDEAVIDARGAPAPPAGRTSQTYVLNVDQVIVPQAQDQKMFGKYPPPACSPADPNANSPKCCEEQGNKKPGSRCGQPAPKKWETMQYVVLGRRLTGKYLVIKGNKYEHGERASYFGAFGRHYYTEAELAAPEGTVKWGSALSPIPGSSALKPLVQNRTTQVAGKASIPGELYLLEVPTNGKVNVVTNINGGADAKQPPPALPPPPPPTTSTSSSSAASSSGAPPPPPGGPCNCRMADTSLPTPKGLGLSALLLVGLAAARRRARAKTSN